MRMVELLWAFGDRENPKPFWGKVLLIIAFMRSGDQTSGTLPVHACKNSSNGYAEEALGGPSGFGRVA